MMYLHFTLCKYWFYQCVGFIFLLKKYLTLLHCILLSKIVTLLIFWFIICFEKREGSFLHINKFIWHSMGKKSCYVSFYFWTIIFIQVKEYLMRFINEWWMGWEERNITLKCFQDMWLKTLGPLFKILGLKGTIWGFFERTRNWII